MVQKDDVDEPAEGKRSRGRPRAYDTNKALARARDTFWEKGYSATTLDDLSASMGMNRPSLYGAFGDKHALYLQTLERYVEINRVRMNEVLSGDLPLRDALLQLYDLALSLYFRDEAAPKGCFLIGTAAVEAVGDETVREVLGKGLQTFDRSFEARFGRAQREGELDPNADIEVLSRLASAILHTLAVRSRVGDERAVLHATAEAGVAMLCAASAGGRKARGK